MSKNKDNKRLQKIQIYKYGITHKNNKLRYGTIGIFSMQNCIITTEQLETIRILLRRSIGKKIKFWIKIKPNKPITRKPIGIRMGKGKGNVEKNIFFLKKYELILEIKYNKNKITHCIKKLIKLNRKLPIHTYIIHIS